MKCSVKVQRLLVLLLIMLQIGLLVPALQAAGPVMTISKYSLSADSISKGEEFSLTLSIKNESEQSLSQVLAEVENASGFTLADSQSQMELASSIAPDQSRTFSIDMVYQGGGDGQLPLRFIYNREGYSHPISEEKYFPVPIEGELGEAEAERVIAIEDKETLYMSAGSQVTASIKLKNQKADQLQEVLIKASFASEVPFSFPAEQIFYFRSWAGGETKTIQLSLASSDEAAYGTYIFQLDSQYSNAAGESGKNQENWYIKLQDARVPPQLDMVCQLDPEDCLIAEEGLKLPISLKNQGQIAARDITLSLERLSTDGIFLSSGSNKQYLDIIGGGREKQLYYLLERDPALSEGLYSLLLKADYTDQKGESYQSQWEIELEVKPETGAELIEGSVGSHRPAGSANVSQVPLSRLKVGNIRFTGDMKPGQLINLYCTYYNTGVGSLSNLIIKIQGNFEALDKTLFMGDMVQNSSGFYQTAFKPQEAGEILGQLVFSYQDESGEPLVLMEPFSLSVAADPVPADIDEVKDPKSINSWYIIIPILLTGAATAGWQVQRKKRQNSEA